MSGRRSQFNRLRQAALAAVIASSANPLLRAECTGVKGARVGITAAGYVAGEALAIATQHH